MKIPEASANIGAYYGNEENGQWQPNGVIIDSGVGGGVVGSGDAGVRPVYPVHIARHIPGYVMAGAYYPAPFPAPAPPPDDFEDYMWMENEEEFDKQVMQQLEEEALMEQCIEAMLEDEQRERQRPQNGHAHYATTSNGPSLSLEETVSRSTLNPLAAEFVPGGRPAEPTVPESSESAAAPQESAPSTEEAPAPREEDSKTDEVQKEEPPESEEAAEERRKEKKTEKKDKKPAPAKQEPKKKPAAAKSDTKVQQVKKKEVKEVRAVKSETKVEDSAEDEPAKPQLSPAEEPPSTGPKPINYAAAAKANKPKKPPTEKTPPPEVKPKTEKKPPQKPVQRKNSAK